LSETSSRTRSTRWVRSATSTASASPAASRFESFESHMRNPLTLSLEEIGPAEAAAVGGKTRHLAELSRAGFAVPAAHALPTWTFQAAVQAAGGDLAALLADFAAGGADDEALRNAILAMPLPQALVPALKTVHDALVAAGYESLAVRSSATLEDLDGSSFAGLYETVLDVRGMDALCAAVRKCWASAFAPRVRDYCVRRGLSVAEIQPACLIQGMIPAECAGVVFTVDPVRGHDTEMLIEAVPGLGEALVQGERDPSAWRYDWMGDRLSRDGDALIEDSQIRELCVIALAIQTHYGRPSRSRRAMDQCRLQGRRRGRAHPLCADVVAVRRRAGGQHATLSRHHRAGAAPRAATLDAAALRLSLLEPERGEGWAAAHPGFRRAPIRRRSRHRADLSRRRHPLLADPVHAAGRTAHLVRHQELGAPPAQGRAEDLGGTRRAADPSRSGRSRRARRPRACRSRRGSARAPSSRLRDALFHRHLRQLELRDAVSRDPWQAQPRPSAPRPARIRLPRIGRRTEQRPASRPGARSLAGE